MDNLIQSLRYHRKEFLTTYHFIDFLYEKGIRARESLKVFQHLFY